MKNTAKKTNDIFKRSITAILAAVMTMSSAATLVSSAADTQPDTKTTVTTNNNKLDPQCELNKDLLKVKNVTTATIFKVLEGTTDYGKYFTPALGFITDLVFGPKKDPTQQKLDEINSKIDKLFDRIDDLQEELVNSFGNQLGIQSFYDTFVSYKSQIQTMRRKINEISTDDSLTQLDKIAKIGSLAGSYNDWDNKFENLVGKLEELIKKPSFTQDANIFELTYNHFCGESMFSGEALDKAKPLCNSLMQVYIAGVTTLTECLSAQYYISQLPDEYINQINSEYKANICLNERDILNEIKALNKNIISQETTTGNKRELIYYKDKNGRMYSKDTECQKVNEVRKGVTYYINNYSIEVTPVYGSVKVEMPADCAYKIMYDNVMNRSRRILVNKNSNGEGYQVSSQLNWLEHSDNPNNNGKYTNDKATVSVEWFNENAADPQIRFNDVKAIGSYCSSKNITIRSLLNSVGIDTSRVPANSNIITSSGIDETDPGIKDVIGAFYSNGYYKGINIDKTGAEEQKVKFIDDGYNDWKGEKWCWAPEGSFCWLTK